jgi:hypothetical protein
MSGPKHRSVFWVASTYAVTIGAMAFALYVLAQVASILFARVAALALPVSFLVGVLSLLGLSTRGSEVPTYFVAMGVLHALVVVMFAVLTKRGFARMAEHGQEPSQTA